MPSKTVSVYMSNMWEGDDADKIVVGSMIEIEWTAKIKCEIEIVGIKIDTAEIDYGDKGTTINMVPWKETKVAERVVRVYLNTREGKEATMEALMEKLAED